MAAVSRVLFCLAFWLTPASAQSVMGKAASDEPISIRSDDPDLREAYALARSGLQTFLTLAQAPRPDMSDFAVKVGAPSAREFLWLAPFKPHGDGFIGHVANTPRHIANLKLGDRLLFKREDIVDWKILRRQGDEGQLHRLRSASAAIARTARAFQKAVWPRLSLDITQQRKHRRPAPVRKRSRGMRSPARGR